MSSQQAPTDTQSIVINKSATDVFAFLSDPYKLDRWTFGTWQITVQNDALVEGKSIFDGSTIYVRIAPASEHYLIDYHIGIQANQLQPRIFIRLIPGEIAGLDEHSCIVMMTAVRAATMPEERWQRLITAHAFELQLLKSLLETGYDHRTDLSAAFSVAAPLL